MIQLKTLSRPASQRFQEDVPLPTCTSKLQKQAEHGTKLS